MTVTRLIRERLVLQDGTEPLPGLTYEQDDDSGIWRPAPGVTALVSQGARAFSTGPTFSETIGPLRIPDGTSGSPGLQFTNDVATGIYLPVFDVLGLSTTGSIRFSVGPGYNQSWMDLRGTDGTSVAPSYTFANDTNTGVYSAGADILGLVAGGGQIANVSLAGFSVDQGAFTVASGDITATNGDILAANGFIRTANGAAGSPIVRGSDADTGMFFSGAFARFSSAGVERLAIGSSVVLQNNTPLSIADGSSAAPAIRFGADTNTGIYRPVSDVLGFSAGGGNRLNVSSGQISATVPYRAPIGTNAAPAYSFSSDTDTGLYRWTTNGVGLAAGTTPVYRATPTDTIILWQNGSRTWNYQSDGNVVCYQGATAIWTLAGGFISDSRVKNNVSTYTGTSQTLIDALTVKQFNWNPEEISGMPTTLQTGFIAQEVELVIPEAVTTLNAPVEDVNGDVTYTGQESKTVEYDKIIPHLIKAVQELSARVAVLEAAA